MIQPNISVVICTDGRAATLDRVIGCLQHLAYPNFEVIVVRGPTEDGISEVLARWDGLVKVGHNPERNLSASRNIGIGLAAGDIVAFLDDDAFPEPDWLTQLAAAYEEPEVGGAGGFVFNPDGYSFQYRYGTTDRLARADLNWVRAAPELCYPFSANHPHLLGANSSFRRAALLDVRGFDEEYEYFLDETDLALRIVDSGWKIVQIEGACVHHKFMPSALRNENRIVTNWYPIIKNKLYFGLRHGLPYYPITEVMDHVRDHVREFERNVNWAISVDKLEPHFRERLQADAERAWCDGLTRGLQGTPCYGEFSDPPPAFLPFASKPSAAQAPRCWCFLSQDYPPGPVGGIGRFTHQLARGLADLGHEIHVITKSKGPETIDFESGVWVHRVRPSENDALPKELAHLPDNIARYAARLRREIDVLADRREVHCVSGPIWDCEPIGLLGNKSYPVVLSLHTTLKSYVDSQPPGTIRRSWRTNFVEPMLRAECRLLMEADALHANSAAIVETISAAYGLHPDDARITIQPHGVDDWRDMGGTAPDPVPDGWVRLLYVGRLEPRKGIDVLLAAAEKVLATHHNVILEVVGNDAVPFGDGKTVRTLFAERPVDPEIRRRIRFHGEVDEERLRGFYAACDALITPSRYESFGLMLVEGMMYGKPVVGCAAGGMREVVADGETGFLAQPGDVPSLVDCIERLVSDPALRARMGEAARQRYERWFSTAAMARGVERLLRNCEAQWQARQDTRRSA